MNSRPITPLSSYPNDLTALTPAHLLIGEPLTTNVDPYAPTLQVNLLTRWKLVTHLKNEFWRKWSHEYLNQLQQRYKWKQKCHNVQPGTIVIIKEDNLPPMKWPLGRILSTIKGEDGLVRVAKIKTATSIIRRPIHRLAPLPTEDEERQNNFENSTESTLQTKQFQAQHNSPQLENAESSRNPRKKIRLSSGTAIVTLLLTCLTLPFAKGAQVEVIPFHSNPGIYFENLGAAHIVTSEWNLITYYNMELYWSHFNQIYNYSTILEKACLVMHNSGPCSKIVLQLKQMTEEVDQTNQLLRPSQSTRFKRGAINIIGNIASTLFGVLDNEYAKEMSTTIDKIHQNEDHLINLMRNQTSILETTINVIKKDHKTIQEEFQHVEKLFNDTELQLITINNELHDEKASQTFTYIAIQMMLAISNFQRIQGSILDILTDTHHGKINSLLISPQQLIKELNIIKGNLPNNLNLPIQTTDILKFYNTVSIEGRITTKYIIFKIKLPLILTEDFELFKLISVPVQINHTYAAIRPSFPFLIVNLHRDQYQPLTEQDLQKCISINIDNHICPQRHPLYRIGSSVSACEIKLFNNLAPGSTCSAIKMESGPHWIQMHSSSQWIYALDKPQTINIVCDHNMTRISIKDAGILKLHSGCIIKQPSITIQSHNLYPTINKLAFIPSINFSDIISPFKLQSALHYTSSYLPHSTELETIKQELRNLNHQLPNTTLSHQAHHYTLSCVSMLSITSIIIYLVWNSRRKIKSSNATTITPATSQNSSNEESIYTEPHVIRVFDN